MPLVKTVQEAFEARNIPFVMPDLSAIPEEHRKSVLSYFNLVIVFDAVNEDWRPDWSDEDQLKYFPWHWVDADKERPAGFGFSGSYCGRSGTSTSLGSRLCCKTENNVMHIVNTFPDLFKDFLLR